MQAAPPVNQATTPTNYLFTADCCRVDFRLIISRLNRESTLFSTGMIYSAINFMASDICVDPLSFNSRLLPGKYTINIILN